MKYSSTNLLPIIICVMVVLGCNGFAGNVERLAYVPSNIRYQLIDQYQVYTDLDFEIPDSLMEFTLDYDHMTTRSYYFREKPRSIYNMAYSSGCSILSVVNLEDTTAYWRSGTISDSLKVEFSERYLNEIAKPVWKAAICQNIEDSLIYNIVNCDYYKYCQ